jgi:hypothetical protein
VGVRVEPFGIRPATAVDLRFLIEMPPGVGGAGRVKEWH